MLYVNKKWSYSRFCNSMLNAVVLARRWEGGGSPWGTRKMFTRKSLVSLLEKKQAYPIPQKNFIHITRKFSMVNHFLCFFGPDHWGKIETPGAL